MVNLTPVGRLIPLRNEPSEGGVIRHVSSLTDWSLEVQLLVKGRRVKREEHSLGGTDGPGVRDLA